MNERTPANPEQPTPSPPPPPKPKHDLTVVWEREMLDGQTLDLTGWECETIKVGTETYVTTASGPCPRCRGPASNSREWGSGPVPEIYKLEAKPIDVHLTCNCRNPHNKEGATGCGREWIVVCKAEIVDKS
jgi:hypothetical protein